MESIQPNSASLAFDTEPVIRFTLQIKCLVSLYETQHWTEMRSIYKILWTLVLWSSFIRYI